MDPYEQLNGATSKKTSPCLAWFIIGIVALGAGVGIGYFIHPVINEPHSGGGSPSPAPAPGPAPVPNPPLCEDGFAKEVEGYLIDLDGTMYDPKGLSEGAEKFFHWLNSTGKPYVFLSNTGEKGPLGTQTKFLTPPFNISSEAIPLNQIYTAAGATAEFLQDNAPEKARLYVLQSTASFGKEPNKVHDSCYKVIERTVKKELFQSWEIRTDLTETEVKTWASEATTTPTFVVLCADGKVSDDTDPVTDKPGYTDWDFSLMSRGGWLIQNGATFVSHAPDTHNFVMDPNFPGVNLNTPGPGTFHALLVSSSYPAAVDRTFVVGKGGNKGDKYMIEKGLELLEALRPKGSKPLDPSKVAMIGDTLNTDIAAGNSGNIASILVTKTGFHNVADLKYYPGVVPTCVSDDVGKLIHD